jgi:hypothetical protein
MRMAERMFLAYIFRIQLKPKWWSQAQSLQKLFSAKIENEILNGVNLASLNSDIVYVEFDRARYVAEPICDHVCSPKIKRHLDQ